MKICLYLLLIFSFLLPTGCYSLRKKFIRKKVKQDEPVVCANFKEYPNGDAGEAYRDYAVFFRGWMSEAITILKDNGNCKRVRYSIDEALDDLDGMIGLCAEPVKSNLTSLRKKLYLVYVDFDSIRGGSDFNRSRLTYDLEGIKKQFETDFSINDVKGKLQ